MTSPTQLSNQLLRENGWTTQVVERWDHYSKRRIDLFQFGDIVAVKAGERALLIQTTTGTNLAARRDKIFASEKLPAVLSGFRVVLHGWRKLLVKRGGKARRWMAMEQEVVSPTEYREMALCGAPVGGRAA